jgi:zinc transport system substrate-binding protein
VKHARNVLAVAVFFVVLGNGNFVLASAVRVVATIAPVHSLVSMVMGGVGEPALLLEGGETPHRYSLRPSQSRLLAAADVIVRIGDPLESFLRKPLKSLAKRASVIDLIDVHGVLKLPVSTGRSHDHSGHYHNHSRRGTDPHIWLHTSNARIFLNAVADGLSKHDPGNAVTFRRNAETGSRQLAALKQEIDKTLAPVRKSAFATFHDAWRYFSAEFGLSSAGALTVNPERPPGARRLAQIQTRIRDRQIRCVFAEPQFSGKTIEAVVRGTSAKIGVLDPLGARLSPGAGLWPTLMQNLARDIASCLRQRDR